MGRKFFTQLVRLLSQYAKVAGSVPSQTEHTQESINECTEKWNNKLMFLFFFLPLPLFKKLIKNDKNFQVPHNLD